MATVRIYKVAELLNTTSQEVIALLKRDHGIEVKSASSTIEEVVARQFVERLARQRNINCRAATCSPNAGRAAAGPRRPAPARSAGAAEARRAGAAAAAAREDGQTGRAAAETPRRRAAELSTTGAGQAIEPEPSPAPQPRRSAEPEPPAIEAPRRPSSRCRRAAAAASRRRRPNRTARG